MPTPNEVYRSFAYQPFYYANGFQITNDATTPNSLLDIGAGSIEDSTATYQLQVTVPIVINSATLGLNGIDTGTVAASKVYSVYVVFDPVNANTPGAIISLSPLTPLLPFGYSAYALIGHVTTDSSAHFLKGYWLAGNTGYRQFYYDAPQATSVTAGNVTTYTAISLAALVPATAISRPVMISYAFTPGAASRTLKMQPGNATGDAVTITGQVTSVIVSGINTVLAQLVTAVPTINYKVANAGDAVAINVAGYIYNI